MRERPTTTDRRGLQVDAAAAIDWTPERPLREQRSSSERSLREREASYDRSLAEHELVALWLLGRVPASVLPWPLLRAGRAGRGPGPDVREAAFQHDSGVPLVGDIEVHLRASDFVRHGHASDPAYGGLILHLAHVRLGRRRGRLTRGSIETESRGRSSRSTRSSTRGTITP